MGVFTSVPPPWALIARTGEWDILWLVWGFCIAVRFPWNISTASAVAPTTHPSTGGFEYSVIITCLRIFHFHFHFRFAAPATRKTPPRGTASYKFLSRNQALPIYEYYGYVLCSTFVVLVDLVYRLMPAIARLLPLPWLGLCPGLGRAWTQAKPSGRSWMEG